MWKTIMKNHNSNYFREQLCNVITTLAALETPRPRTPVLNFSEYEPWRTLYMFYCRVTLEAYIIFGTKNPTPWKCILFSGLKTQAPVSVYYFRDWKQEPHTIFELKTHGPASVYYFRDWKPKALEVYTIFGPENWKPCKCILFSDMKTQGPGSVYYFRDWKPTALEVYTMFGPRNSRPWKWS